MASAMAEECVRVFRVINDLGLHARAATKLVQLANKYTCDVDVSLRGQKANAKSVMGVLLLCGGKGSDLEVSARGEGAAACVEAIGALMAARFGEPS